MSKEEAPKAKTVGEALEGLLPGILTRDAMPSWPPDVFAIATSLLLESGAYLKVVERWPPTREEFPGVLDVASEDWVQEVRDLAKSWRSSFSTEDSSGKPPETVKSWWQELLGASDLAISEAAGTSEVVCCLVHLSCVADEASAGVGIGQPGHKDNADFFYRRALNLLARSPEVSSLCVEIDRSRAVVLPKSHTPQTGITVRSLSHHLSLWTALDVSPSWWTLSPPWWWTSEADAEAPIPHSLNLLLAPWPMEIAPTDFQPAQPATGRLDNMSSRFGFFRFEKQPDPNAVGVRLLALYRAAGRLSDRVDGIVLPELALHQTEYDRIRGWTSERGGFLISGIRAPAREDADETEPGRNRVVFEIPLSEEFLVEMYQDKHHRWRLDAPQITQYALGGQLDPSRAWWEYSETDSRSLTFVSMLPWLSMCALVCEDLARQDPVSRLVRSVGPNLVVALLMDGPQLDSRWPARYATVLAEDPGSSVLTLTSFGMCSRSRPPGEKISRTVALWKDAYSGKAIEIDLEDDAEGILLNLVRTRSEEWSADGRSDHRTAGYPTLAGIHQVRISKEDKSLAAKDLKNWDPVE